MLRIFSISLLVTMMSSCLLLGPEKSVEIIGKGNQIERINLTPRHYKSKEHCRHALDVLPANLTASLSPLSADQRTRLKWPAMLAGFKPKQCDSFKNRGEIMETLVDILAEKTRRVGVILQASPHRRFTLVYYDQRLIMSQRRQGLSRRHSS